MLVGVGTAAAFGLIVFVVLFVSLARDGKGAGTGGEGAYSADDTDHLTAEQRSAWEKRRTPGAKSVVFPFALIGTTEPKWHIYSVDNRAILLPTWTLKPLFFIGRDKDETFKKVCEDLKTPRFSAIAMVNVFGERNPVVVEWLIIDKNGVVTKQKAAQSKDHEKSLVEFFQKLQKQSGD